MTQEQNIARLVKEVSEKCDPSLLLTKLIQIFEIVYESELEADSNYQFLTK